jgi:hypothetical protein
LHLRANQFGLIGFFDLFDGFAADASVMLAKMSKQATTLLSVPSANRS